MALSITAKIGLVLLIIGAVIFLIGFCTPYWSDGEVLVPQIFQSYYSSYRDNRKIRQRQVYVNRKFNLGLWKHCEESNWIDPSTRTRRHAEGCRNVVGDDNDLAGEYRATQFFETVAFLLLIPAFLCLILGACLEACKNRRIMPVLAGVCAVVAAGCIFLGAIIWGTWSSNVYYSVSDNLSWSFALAIVGGVFVAFAGVIILVGAILRK